jgi:hypothetical protein
MRIEEVASFLHKRINALKAKCDVANEKGLFDLYHTFDNELKDVQMSSALVDKLLIQMKHLNFPKIRETIASEVMVKLPRLSFRISDKKIKSEVGMIIKKTLESNLVEWIPPKNV